MLPGDDADFTAFLSASSRRLLRTAYLITGDVEAAQDLLQTALERTYRRWGGSAGVNCQRLTCAG